VSDFFESAKQKLGQGVSRMGWEADKLRRVNAKQGEISALKQQREQLIVDFSNMILTLYRQGQVTDPKLRQFCERILDMEGEMTAKTAELELLRSETYQGAQAARAAGGAAAPSSGRTARPSAGVPPMESAAGAGSAGNQAGPAFCPTCGEPVRSRALYCNKCGTKLR
jgi:hypothetical protein